MQLIWRVTDDNAFVSIFSKQHWLMQVKRFIFRHFTDVNQPCLVHLSNICAAWASIFVKQTYVMKQSARLAIITRMYLEILTSWWSKISTFKHSNRTHNFIWKLPELKYNVKYRLSSGEGMSYWSWQTLVQIAPNLPFSKYRVEVYADKLTDYISFKWEKYFLYIKPVKLSALFLIFYHFIKTGSEARI